MAGGCFVGVIYIIIASTMKTLPTNAADITSQTKSMHALLAIAGVLIAIVCAMTMMTDAQHISATTEFAIPEIKTSITREVTTFAKLSVRVFNLFVF